MSIKRIPFFLLFTCIVLFSGCTTDDSMSGNMPEGKLISLTIPANYHSYYNYVNYFVNSLDGKIITSKEIESDEEVVFEADQNENSVLNRYDFSRCFVKDNGTYKSITINTYIGILPFSLELATAPSKFLGNAYVKFTNVPAYTSFLLAYAYSYTTSGSLSTTTFSIPLYSDLPKGLFIRLNTLTGDYYKFVDDLVAGQTSTVSLSGMNSDFGSADILSNSDIYTYLSLSISKYVENDFSPGSYCVFSSSVSGNTFTYTYPLSFLPGHNIRTNLTASNSSRYTHYYAYSVNHSNSIDLLEGDISFTDKFPGSFSYDIDLNDKVDIVIFSRSHTTTFRDNNGFRVSWTLWVSPSVRDVKLPEIPDEILNFLSDDYGINDLQLSNMEAGSVSSYQYGRSEDFDDFMKYYWLGWTDPRLNDVDKYLNISLTGKKNDSEAHTFNISPLMYNSNPDYQ